MRKLLVLVLLIGCAKSASKEGATSPPPAETLQTTATTANAPQAPPVDRAPPPPPDEEHEGGAVTVGASRGADDSRKDEKVDAKQEARAHGVLGSTDRDLFTSIDGYVAKVEAGPIGTLAKEIQACYDKAIASKPGLVGSLELRFTYKPDGTTANVTVAKSTLGYLELENCIIELIKAAKLTPAKAAVKTRARIAFKKQ